jgi:hypothetical protein
MVDIGAILSFVKGAQSAVSSAAAAQNAQGAASSAQGVQGAGNGIGGALGGIGGGALGAGGAGGAGGAPGGIGMPAIDIPQLDFGRSEYKPPQRVDMVPVKLKDNPVGPDLGSAMAAYKLPRRVDAIGDTSRNVSHKDFKTITDEDYQTARKRGSVTGMQWLNENAKAAQQGERDPLTFWEIQEVLRDDSLDETLNDKEKREKREAAAKAISTFGNIGANIANFATAVMGGIPGDYNNRAATEREKEIEARRQRLKEKYDDILLKATGDDITYARNLNAAREKAAADKEMWQAEQDNKAGQDNIKNDETTRKSDAQIKKWNSDAAATTENAATRSSKVNYMNSKGNNKDYKSKVIAKDGDYTLTDKEDAEAVNAQVLNAYKERKTANMSSRKKTEFEKQYKSWITGNKSAAVHQAIDVYPELADMYKDRVEFTPRLQGNQPDEWDSNYMKSQKK